MNLDRWLHHLRSTLLGSQSISVPLRFPRLPVISAVLSFCLFLNFIQMRSYHPHSFVSGFLYLKSISIFSPVNHIAVWVYWTTNCLPVVSHLNGFQVVPTEDIPFSTVPMRLSRLLFWNVNIYNSVYWATKRAQAIQNAFLKELLCCKTNVWLNLPASWTWILYFQYLNGNLILPLFTCT